MAYTEEELDAFYLHGESNVVQEQEYEEWRGDFIDAAFACGNIGAISSVLGEDVLDEILNNIAENN